MAKKVAILEGDKSRRFGGVKYLRTNLTGGGTCEWVPEDDRKLKTKTIKKNGTYRIADEKGDYYGFSQVTVSVSNSTTGKKKPSTGGDGNEYSVKVNEDTGMLEEKVLPSSIRITTQPSKTTYTNGESISLNGAVIKAYKADGGLWVAEGYSGGVIPLNELEIEPTTASGGGSDEGIWTDGNGVNALRINYEHQTATDGEYTWETYCYPHALGDATNARTGSTVPLTLRGNGEATLFVTKFNGATYAIRVSGDNRLDSAVYFNNELTNYSNAPITGWFGGGSSTAKTTTTEWTQAPWDLRYVPESTSNPSAVDPSTLHPTGGGGGAQIITVKWNRPEDEKELTDTFTIDVTSSNNNQGNTGGNNTGGGGGSW